jgi:hypothetical protein
MQPSHFKHIPDMVRIRKEWRTRFPALRQPGTDGSACHEWTSTYSPYL